MFGLLNLNKPAGATSRDVVNQIQSLVRPHKVGHAGTLDPLATGVLVVCIGKATRLIPYVQRLPKQYRATFLLGRESDTEDIEGAVVEHADAPQPDRIEIQRAAGRLTGEIQQLPPAYSALKVGGRRAYRLARTGQQVTLEPRPVIVHELAVRDYDYPRLEVDVACGSGTYIRSLGRDLARAVGTTAVMSSLVRTAIGRFSVDDAHQPDHVTRDSLQSQLLPPLLALDALTHVRLDDDEVTRLTRGVAIADRFGLPDAELAAFDQHGRLVAILSRDSKGRLKPSPNFAAEIRG